MLQQVTEADFVLVVCTETYLQPAMLTEGEHVGLGASFEAALINTKFIPVVFSHEDKRHVLLSILKIGPPIIHAISVAVKAYSAILGVRAWRKHL
jgi:hypothetical protein